MKPTLDTADLKRLATALDVLLAPAAQDCGATWPANVPRALSALVGVDTSSFIVARSEGPRVAATSADSAMVDAYTSRYGQFDAAAAGIIEHRLQIAHHHSIPDLEARQSPEFLHDFLRPHRLNGMLALSTFRGAALGAQVYFSVIDERVDRETMEHRAALLQAVLPAFRSGVELWQRLSGVGAEITTAIDLISEPIALYSTSGEELHRNPALNALLATEREREKLITALRRIVRDLGTHMSKRSGLQIVRPEQIVQAAVGNYRIRGGLGAGDRHQLILITVEGDRPAALSDTDLQRRFHLTPRERDLVRLAARGLTNAEIAEQLGISRFTVRNRFEQVFSKLGVRRRGEMAGILSGADWRSA